MFTGLVQSRGKVIENIPLIGNQAHRLALATDIANFQLGESIAINGVCLTVVKFDKLHCLFDVSQETLSCTNLGDLQAGAFVNLERAMSASERFGGHYVTGHIDTTARIQTLEQVGDYLKIEVGEFALASSMLYLVPKGSVTLDGVSLTINTVQKESISIMLIPHTLAETTLGQAAVGSILNVEFDYIARIVAHQLRNHVLFQDGVFA